MPQLNKIYRKTNSVSGSNPHAGLQDPMAISPLQRFVRAKKLINQTFDELKRYLTDVNDFLIECEISDDLDRETKRDLDQVLFSSHAFLSCTVVRCYAELFLEMVIAAQAANNTDNYY